MFNKIARKNIIFFIFLKICNFVNVLVGPVQNNRNIYIPYRKTGIFFLFTDYRIKS